MKTKKINLWNETVDVLLKNNKRFEDAIFISDGEAEIPKPVFEKTARETFYDNGYGDVHINTDLVIAGDSWWLERYEDDGKEGWLFKQFPARKSSLTISGAGIFSSK